MLTQLFGDKIRAESELFVVKRSSGIDTPGIAPLQSRLDSINRQIDQLRNQLAGNSSQARNLAASLVRFEELEVKRQFAEAMYGYARDGLDRARRVAEHQSVYLTVFVPAGAAAGLFLSPPLYIFHPDYDWPRDRLVLGRHGLGLGFGSSTLAL